MRLHRCNSGTMFCYLHSPARSSLFTRHTTVREAKMKAVNHAEYLEAVRERFGPGAVPAITTTRLQQQQGCILQHQAYAKATEVPMSSTDAVAQDAQQQECRQLQKHRPRSCSERVTDNSFKQKGRCKRRWSNILTSRSSDSE